MNGEGYSCYQEDLNSEPNLGIYSEGTLKEKSESLDKLGVEGFDSEYVKQIRELKKNTPTLPTEEVEKLKKEHVKYLVDNKVQIKEMQQKLEKQEVCAQ